MRSRPLHRSSRRPQRTPARPRPLRRRPVQPGERRRRGDLDGRRRVASIRRRGSVASACPGPAQRPSVGHRPGAVLRPGHAGGRSGCRLGHARPCTRSRPVDTDAPRSVRDQHNRCELALLRRSRLGRARDRRDGLDRAHGRRRPVSWRADTAVGRPHRRARRPGESSRRAGQQPDSGADPDRPGCGPSGAERTGTLVRFRLRRRPAGDRCRRRLRDRADVTLAARFRPPSPRCLDEQGPARGRDRRCGTERDRHCHPRRGIRARRHGRLHARRRTST